MEYRLLKTIEPTLGGFLCPSEAFPRLSAFPATDFVNPGLGQISRLYSFYVPLYNARSLHTIQKKMSEVGAENLEGSGNLNPTENVDSSENELIEQQMKSDPMEFNATKRKRMGSPVQV